MSSMLTTWIDYVFPRPNIHYINSIDISLWAYDITYFVATPVKIGRYNYYSIFSRYFIYPAISYPCIQTLHFSEFQGKLINLRYPFLSSNVYSSPQMAEGAKRLFHIYTEFLKSVSEAEDLHYKFTKYCAEDCAAKEMFSCLRRQV